MLIAQKTSGEKILAQECLKSEKDLLCPLCKQPVILKKGTIKIPHFAHLRREDCQSFSEGETQEHLQNKLFLQKWTQKGVLEAYLPELKQRPDLLLDFLAIEVQCSSLKIERFMERTNNYLKHGYHPWWLLGKKLGPNKLQQPFTTLQKAVTYYSKQKGFFLWLIRADSKEIWLLYDLHWHFQGNVHFKIKKWHFLEVPLSQMFQFQVNRTPFQWGQNDYRMHLQKKLMTEQEGARRLQEKIYLQGGNLLDLTSWCYEASPYQFFFEDQLLFLRFSFLQTKNYQEWLEQLKNLEFSWLFPLASQKLILEEIYNECIFLSKK